MAKPVLHYGPVYEGRPLGSSFALCNPAVDPEKSANLTTHKPWVDCDACRKEMERRPWLK